FDFARRLAALSVAKRVTEEMETEFGDLVGYAFRFEDGDAAENEGNDVPKAPSLRRLNACTCGNETDYLALLSFKSKITHDPYKVLASWNYSFHFCDWSGVSCGKRHKRVTVLQLVSKGLEGSLSPHVGNLIFLRELFLRNNSFQGTIPHELGRLSRLRCLFLDRNKFSGVIPTNLSSCSNLELLYLNLNELTGSIPKGMSLLPKLITLLINDNKLTGGIPPITGNITSMEVFSANRNPLGGSIPDTLGLWKSLTALYYGGCNLYGSIPHSIFNLSLLVNLTFADNHLTGSLPSEIAQSWKFPVCYDDDDDEEGYNSLNGIIFELPSYSAVTPTEPIDSLSMGNEHLNTILATESDEFIKSCVENLVPNPIIISSKIDSLFDEFAGELTLLKSFPPGIDKTDCHPEEEIYLTKRLLYDNSSPRPPEEIVFLPIHVGGNHWVTGVIDLPNAHVYVFDSLPNEGRRNLLWNQSQRWTSVVNNILQGREEQKRDIERKKKEIEEIKRNEAKQLKMLEKMQKYIEDMNVEQGAQFQTHPNSSSFFNIGTPTHWQTPRPSQHGSSNWQAQMSAQAGPSNWQSRMPAQSATAYWQPAFHSHPGTYNSNLQPSIERQHDVAGLLNPNILNRGKREQRPSFYKRSPYMEQPATTVLPKQRGGDDVVYLGGRFTGNYLVYENVDPEKVKRENYVTYTRVVEQLKSLFRENAYPSEQVRLNVLTKLQEALDEEAILEEQILALMHRFADRFTDRKGQLPVERLVTDETEARSDGFQVGPTLTGVVLKMNRYLEKNDDMYEKMTRFMEDMRRVPEANTTPIIADQHFGVSDISGFQSYRGVPSSFYTLANNSSFFNMATPSNWQTPNLSNWLSPSNWKTPNTSYLGTSNSQPSIPSQPGTSNWQNSMTSRRQDAGILDSNLCNRARREPQPSVYMLSLYTVLPSTTVLTKKRIDKTNKKGKTKKLSPLNLGNTFADENVSVDDVTITGVQQIDNYFNYEIVDPDKHMDSWIQILIREKTENAN
nr:protein kinase-like domain-containing protein [Tanacetum cinerariifolium]